jgi:hypothetical protein
MEPEIAFGIFTAQWRGRRAMNIDAVPENPERWVEYRQRAAECRALAYELCNEDSREELLALADVWMTLADPRRARVRTQ